MRKYALMAAALGLSMAGVAKAGFVGSYTTSVATGAPFTGDVTYTVYALNNGSDGTSGVQTADLTITDTAGANLLVRAKNKGNGTSTLDLGGLGSTVPYASYVSLDAFQDYAILSSTPSNTTLSNTGLTDPTVFSLSSFEVAEFSQPTGSTLPANTAPGTQVAVIVVPAADALDKITITGNISSENGTLRTFSETINAPEPASLGLLGLGIGGLFVRRRRTA